MFWRILSESFRRARVRQSLAVLAIAFGVSVGTAMFSVFVHVGDRVARELRSFGANITVTPAADSLPVEIGGVDYRPAAAGAYLPEDHLPKLKTIFWRNNIIAFAPYLSQPVILPDGSRVVLAGTWFDREYRTSAGEQYRSGVRELNPSWNVEGRWPSDRTKAVPEALAGRRLAGRLRLSPGQRVSFRLPGATDGKTREVDVTGVLSTGGAEEEQLLAPLALVQDLAGQAGRFRRLQVSALTQPEDAFARRNPKSMTPAEYDRWYCTAYVSAIVHQIQEVLPGTAARQVRQVAQNEGEVLRRVQALMLLVTVAALAASAIAVSSATAAVIGERRAEIALMEALGATRIAIAAQFLAEAALKGLAGGLAGYLAGFVLAGWVGRQVFGDAAIPPAVVLPMALTASVLVSWIGASWPLRQALHQLPALALKESRI